MGPLELVKLTALMNRTRGLPELKIGLIDGPVVMGHADLADECLRDVPGGRGGQCTHPHSAACQHGTFVAGILCAKRGTAAPAICPDCTLLARPIFSESGSTAGGMPSATPWELAQAVLDCIKAGARVLNISAALTRTATRVEPALQGALDEAARRGVIVVAAAGDQGSLGSSAITSHPWVIPVVSYDRRGRPMHQSNLGGAIGRRGLGAPGDRITSIGASGPRLTLGGSSAAAPFVTGTIALLWSEVPRATAAEMRSAVTQAHLRRRPTVVPPLLDAWAAYQVVKG